MLEVAAVREVLNFCNNCARFSGSRAPLENDFRLGKSAINVVLMPFYLRGGARSVAECGKRVVPSSVSVSCAT